MKNKKLLVGGASALSLATLGLGAFAFFTDTVELNEETKVGTVNVEATAEMKHTQIKRIRMLNEYIYGNEVIDGQEHVERITYPYYPESEYNARYPASLDIDAITSIDQVRAAFEEAPDNINPGDNIYSDGFSNYPGTDHELIVNIENQGSKSVQTRIIFEVTGTEADGVTPLSSEDLRHITLLYDAMNSVSGLTAVNNPVMLPPEIFNKRIELIQMPEHKETENTVTYMFDHTILDDVIDRSQTTFGNVMLEPLPDAVFTDLIFSGVGENAEEELGGYKTYYQETKNETEYSWDIDWTWDIMESEELIEAPTSASFKFDICMNNPILLSESLEEYKQYEEQFARLQGANINIKVIVQGLQYRNTNDRIWETIFEQDFFNPK
jgi:hypothetical protein